MRMRIKTNLDSRIEKCSHLLVVSPEELRGRWLQEFGYDELRIELGCGKGRFTVETAKAEPGVLLVAFEKTANVMVTALERTEQEGLQNIRFVKAFVEDITEYFAPGEVSRIYLNFPDPWPSNRHAKRRLTAFPFLEMYAQILLPGGELHFKTDNLPLFEFSLCELERSKLTLLEETRDLHKNGPLGAMTDYEQKFHSQGLPIYRCVMLL